MKGCDFAWGRPMPSQLRAAGMDFVCRYYTHDRTGKALTRGEAGAYTHAGIGVVSVFEDFAHRPLSGKGGGELDGRFARLMARGCGQPTDAPIYIAVDFPPGPRVPVVREYVVGFATAAKPYPVRIYGDADMVDLAADWKLGPGWQTTAWSAGRLSPHAGLLQTGQTADVGGVIVDVDEARTTDIGSWGIGPHRLVSPAEWQSVLAWVEEHYGQGLWSHVWHVLTSHAAEVRRLIDSGKIPRPGG